MYKPIIQIL